MKGKRPLGRSRRRNNDNIKMYLKYIGRRTWTGLIWLSIATSGGL